jgi:hypothetical protein
MTFIGVLITLLSHAQSAEQIVRNYFEAIGGEEKWNSIESEIDECLLIKKASSNSQVFGIKEDTAKTITKRKKPGKFSYCSLRRGDSFSSILGYNGELFWTQSKSGELSIQSHENAEYFAQTSMTLPYQLLEKSTEIEYLGVEKLLGTEYYTLRIKGKGWLFSSKYFFDTKTRLPFCVVSLDAPTKKYTLFKDFKRVEGVVFHYIEEVYDDQWNLIAESIFTNRRINLPVPDAEFDLPHSK